MKLNIGQTFILKVNPRLKWQNTGIEIASDEKYEFTANGLWIDFFILTNANGYSMKWLMPKDTMKRVPSCKWLAPMGALEEVNDKSFLIGKYLEKKFEGPSRTLLVFANDEKSGGFFLANNWGKVRLTIKRLI